MRARTDIRTLLEKSFPTLSHDLNLLRIKKDADLCDPHTIEDIQNYEVALHCKPDGLMALSARLKDYPGINEEIKKIAAEKNKTLESIVDDYMKNYAASNYNYMFSWMRYSVNTTPAALLKYIADFVAEKCQGEKTFSHQNWRDMVMAIKSFRKIYDGLLKFGIKNGRVIGEITHFFKEYEVPLDKAEFDKKFLARASKWYIADNFDEKAITNYNAAILKPLPPVLAFT